MLEGLDKMDWDELTHAYGPAANTPGHIRALVSQDAAERDQARGDLCHTICHQGTRHTAAAAAVPFLFELVNQPATPDKDKIIGMLVLLAVGYHDEFLPLGI